MAGTKSVPTIDSAAVTFVRVSVRMMDAGGEKRSVSLQVPAAATDAQIEALVNAQQAAQNATIYEVSKQLIWSSVPVEANADSTDNFGSVYDNVVLLCKNVATQKSQDAFIPSVSGIIVLDGDIVDTQNALYQAWRDAVIALLAAPYQAVSARFTERRDKNDSVPA